MALLHNVCYNQWLQFMVTIIVAYLHTIMFQNCIVLGKDQEVCLMDPRI